MVESSTSLLFSTELFAGMLFCAGAEADGMELPANRQRASTKYKKFECGRRGKRAQFFEDGRSAIKNQSILVIAYNSDYLRNEPGGQLE